MSAAVETRKQPVRGMVVTVGVNNGKFVVQRRPTESQGRTVAKILPQDMRAEVGLSARELAKALEGAGFRAEDDSHELFRATSAVVTEPLGPTAFEVRAMILRAVLSMVPQEHPDRMRLAERKTL